jgi:hypothetical protein
MHTRTAVCVGFSTRVCEALDVERGPLILSLSLQDPRMRVCEGLARPAPGPVFAYQARSGRGRVGLTRPAPPNGTGRYLGPGRSVRSVCPTCVGRSDACRQTVWGTCRPRVERTTSRTCTSVSVSVPVSVCLSLSLSLSRSRSLFLSLAGRGYSAQAAVRQGGHRNGELHWTVYIYIYTLHRTYIRNHDISIHVEQGKPYDLMAMLSRCIYTYTYT